jgi:DNA-binding CsgD family transcriptional regulator
MSVYTIMELLENNKGKFMTAKEISNKLDISYISVLSTLRRSIIKRNEVICLQILSKKTNHKTWIYGLKEE